MRTTDILWTKPSELSFYCGLGIPIVMAPAHRQPGGLQPGVAPGDPGRSPPAGSPVHATSGCSTSCRAGTAGRLRVGRVPQGAQVRHLQDPRDPAHRAPWRGRPRSCADERMPEPMNPAILTPADVFAWIETSPTSSAGAAPVRQRHLPPGPDAAAARAVRQPRAGLPPHPRGRHEGKGIHLRAPRLRACAPRGAGPACTRLPMSPRPFERIVAGRRGRSAPGRRADRPGHAQMLSTRCPRKGAGGFPPDHLRAVHAARVPVLPGGGLRHRRDRGGHRRQAGCDERDRPPRPP